MYNEEIGIGFSLGLRIMATSKQLMMPLLACLRVGGGDVIFTPRFWRCRQERMTFLKMTGRGKGF